MPTRRHSPLLLTLLLLSSAPLASRLPAQAAPQTPAQPAAPTTAPDLPEARAAASNLAWLQLVDTAHYPESWKTASAAFQVAVTEEKWESAMKSVRTPLGKLVTRRLAGAKYTKTLPGAPDGEYVVSIFETSFENKKSAQETVISKREPDGNWRLAGYYIK